MGSIQKKGENWYCRRRHTLALGKVSVSEAETVSARVDYLLMRLKQGLMEIPATCDVVTFVQHDGKPPAARVDPPRETTFREFQDAYLLAHGQGAIEANSLDTARIHLAHLMRTFGEGFTMSGLTTRRLQRHVDRRREVVIGVTIKKEIDTLRSAWNWSARMGDVRGEFPGKGLVFPKDEEKLPFMTWAEIERRIAAGGAPGPHWECLYLTVSELDEFLGSVKATEAPDWVNPMLLFAAHTAARRSEMIRARAEDVDLVGGVVTIREKKRIRGRLTTRRVPLSGSLAAVLNDWLPGRSCLFGPGEKPLSVQGAQKAFHRTLRGSRWSVLKGYHCLRHSFISALASQGVDQRLIDEWVGHQTEAMRRRYRHLTPGVQQQAIRSVLQ